MKTISWSRVLAGSAMAIAFALLISGLIIALVIQFSAAENIADVQNLSRFAVVVGVTLGLGCAWGAFVALRGLSANHVLHGALIGLVAGGLHFLVVPNPFILNLLILFMSLAAGVLGARMVELNPPR